MLYTDRRGESWKLWFRKYTYDGTVYCEGIEAMAYNEPYMEVATTLPECANARRFPKPNPFCYWARPMKLLQQMVDEGLVRYTGRTTCYLGSEMCEVMPDKEWLESLRTVNY